MYFLYTLRCVKRGLDHLTSDCSKPREHRSSVPYASEHTVPISKDVRHTNCLNRLTRNHRQNRKTPPKAPPDGAKEINARPRPKRYAEDAVSDNSPLDIVSTTLSQFISNLNSLIGPLISLLTEVLLKQLSPWIILRNHS